MTINQQLERVERRLAVLPLLLGAEPADGVVVWGETTDQVVPITVFDGVPADVTPTELGIHSRAAMLFAYGPASGSRRLANRVRDLLTDQGTVVTGEYRIDRDARSYRPRGDTSATGRPVGYRTDGYETYLTRVIGQARVDVAHFTEVILDELSYAERGDSSMATIAERASRSGLRLLPAPDDPDAADYETIARLGVAMHSRPVWDRALAIIAASDHPGRLVTWWANLVCHLDDDILPPAATVLAWAAWRDRQPLLARCALDLASIDSIGQRMGARVLSRITEDVR